MASVRSSSMMAGSLGSLYSLGAAGGLSDGQLLERFLSRDDPTAAEAAFTALVDRHGSMVLAVCRRELGDLNDAHDAFQATFLVLVSKAAAIRNRESVGGWLFGIARRVSARARVEEARRRRHLERLGMDRRVTEEGPPESSGEPEIDYAPLLEEVHRLPERFRAPVVLHYFEGLSAEATATRLGCARGTVLSRLSRARQRLKSRLERRGAAPMVLIPAADVLTRWLPTPSVPAALAQGTIRAACSLGLAGAAIESVAPAKVAGLSQRVARTLALPRVGAAVSLVVAAVFGVSIGLAATLQSDDRPRPDAAMQRPNEAGAKRPAAAGEANQTSGVIRLRGQVLGPDEKPVAGAPVFLNVPEPFLQTELRRLAVAGPDGRFDLTIPRAYLEPMVKVRESVVPGAALAAFFPGLGPDWKAIDPGKSGEPFTLRLRRDDVPIEGRIISLEGRPIAGLTVKVSYIAEFPPPLLAKLRENAGKMNPALWSEMRNALMPGEDGPIRPARTGPDGRFRLTGIGRDRVALVMVEGGSIEQSFAMVATSSDRGYKPILLPADGSGERKIEGPRFELAVAPGRPIEGIVRDRDTGQPVAGVRISSWSMGTATTDAQGRFRIAGQPRGRENVLDVNVEDRPYIRVLKTLEDAAANVGPVRIEIPFKRGVWVEGRVIDSSTGKPAQAVVTYYPFRDNPHVKECPDASFLNNNISDEPEFRTDADGRFRAIALPGGGLLGVRVSQPGYVFGKRLDDKMAGNVLFTADFRYFQSNYQALMPIDVGASERQTIADIRLTAGRPQQIRIVGPDGHPVNGARMFSFQGTPLTGEEIVGNSLRFTHANPGLAESILIVHEGRFLGAVIEVRGDEPDPVQVILKGTSVVTGRLVAGDGKPRPGVPLEIHYEMKSRGEGMNGGRHDPLTTGLDGRFRIEYLVPGISYSVRALRKNEMTGPNRAEGYLGTPRWTVTSGEAQDWGDVQVKPFFQP